MGHDFSEVGRQVANSLKEGKSRILPLNIQTDAFELSQAIESEIPVNARKHFEGAEEIDKAREKVKSGRKYFESLQEEVNQDIEFEKYGFYSDGKKLFESELDVEERSSSGARSKGLKWYLDVEAIKSGMSAKELSELTGLPLPDQIGKGALPSMKREFLEGKQISNEVNKDVDSISDFFRAYQINNLTIKPVRDKAKEAAEKAGSNETVEKARKASDKWGSLITVGAFSITVLGAIAAYFGVKK